MRPSKKRFWLTVMVGGSVWGVLTALLVHTILHVSGKSGFYEGLATSLVLFPLIGVAYGFIIWKLRHRSR